MGSLDALALNVDNSAKMEITDPSDGTVIKDKDGKPAYIEMLSLDSEVAYKRRQVARKRIFEQVQKGKKIKYTAEQADEDEVGQLVALTKGWYLVDPRSGESLDIPFTPENAETLYSSRQFNWIKEQVSEFIADRENFF